MLHLPQCVSFYLEWRWGRVSFAFTTVCLLLLWIEVEEGLICIYHSVSPSTLNGGGGKGLICIYQSVPWMEVGEGLICIYHTVCLPLPWVEVGEGLICIYHSVSPSTLNVGGGGSHLHLPQCVSLYLEWRWGRGSFAFTNHSVSPSTLNGGGGGSHLHPSQCHSLYLGWR